MVLYRGSNTSSTRPRGARGRLFTVRSGPRWGGSCESTLVPEGGLVFDDEGFTVGKYLDKWLEGCLRGSVRQSNFERYEIAVRAHIKPVLGRLKLTNLTPTHVAGFYQDKLAAGFASASVNKLHVVLHKALDQAVKWHMVPHNVAEVVKVPKPAPEEIRPLDRRQAKALLEAARGEALSPCTCWL